MNTYVYLHSYTSAIHLWNKIPDKVSFHFISDTVCRQSALSCRDIHKTTDCAVHKDHLLCEL